jgi:beta-glucanase (GH16 family)
LPCSDPSWKVTFRDDFLGNALNLSSWTARDNMTHGPTERQLYLADAVTVSDGALRIFTRREEEAGGVVSPNGTIYNFSSGWVESRGKVFDAYGRLEVRAKLPSALAGAEGAWSDAWPAHWLMPEPSTSNPPDVCWPVGGEIDIMEGFHPRGDNEFSIYNTYHWAEECNEDLWGSDSGKFPALNDTDREFDFADWHTYAVEWSEDALEWFVDDEHVYRRVAGEPESLFVPSDPMYIILNTALTPWTASLDPGFPVEHAIDSVVWCQTATK